jgi:tetratricopeptide (TPR) repeat protein
MIGETVNGSRIEGKVCVTTTGTVYRAKDAVLEVPRAVKIIHPQLVNDVVRERFNRTLPAWGKLDHPNFVHIFAAVDTGKNLGFVMEFVEGSSLRQMLQSQGRLGISQAVGYALYIAKALAFAHEHNIVHRKMSPDNIIIRKDESLKVMGLGALKELTADRQITPPKFCIGKPKYMAPEQFAGHYSSCSDQYTWGTVFYEMVTGKPPFVSNDLRKLYRMHMQEKPTLPRTLNAEISGELEEIIVKTLAKKAENRFPTMHILIEAIKTATDRLDDSEDSSLQSLMYRGRHALERRKLETAVFFFNRAASLYGKDSPAFAEAYAKRDQALHMYQEEVAIRKVRDIYSETLRCFDEEDETKQAFKEETRRLIMQILQVMRDYPESTRIRGTRMDLLREMHDLVEETEKILACQIEESKKITEKGKILLEEQHYDEAMLIFSQAIEVDPYNEEATLLRNASKKKHKMVLVAECYRDGRLAMNKKNYAQATSFFEKVIELQPDHRGAFQYLQIACAEEAQQKKRLGQIGKYYSEALELYEKWQYDQALEKFAKVLELDPENTEVKSFLSAAKDRLHEDDKLEEIGFFYKKGVTFFNEHKWREAMACFNYVMREMSNHKKALEYQRLAREALDREEHYNLIFAEAMGLFRKSDYEQAQDRFNYLYQLDPKNPEVKRYRRLCAEFIQQNIELPPSQINIPKM